MINLTLDKALATITLSPTPTGALATTDVVATVNTNNSTGYTLTMNSQTANTNLVDTVNSSLTIPSTANVAAGTLTANTWGYNSEPNRTTPSAPVTNFLAIPAPTGTVTINSKTSPVANDNTVATFGVNADLIQSPGVYQQVVVFTAATNYVAPPMAQTGDPIQTVTTDTCPTANKIRVVDARDDATYWVQKMADNKCWMLTNLAYAGGGTNTYNDTKTITNTNALSYTEPYYMIPTGSNKTVEPQDPSTSTSGTGQYGYLYNWCAAMGGQTTTSACMNATTPLPDQNISICPSGWRLPTGNAGGEYEALTTAIGATNNTAGSTVLRSSWLGLYSGSWVDGFGNQGSYGRYWSSTQSAATVAYTLIFTSSYVTPGTSNGIKHYGFAVRCLAL